MRWPRPIRSRMSRGASNGDGDAAAVHAWVQPRGGGSVGEQRAVPGAGRGRARHPALDASEQAAGFKGEATGDGNPDSCGAAVPGFLAGRSGRRGHAAEAWAGPRPHGGGIDGAAGARGPLWFVDIARTFDRGEKDVLLAPAGVGRPSRAPSTPALAGAGLAGGSCGPERGADLARELVEGVSAAGIFRRIGANRRRVHRVIAAARGGAGHPAGRAATGVTTNVVPSRTGPQAQTTLGTAVTRVQRPPDTNLAQASHVPRCCSQQNHRRTLPAPVS